MINMICGRKKKHFTWNTGWKGIFLQNEANFTIHFNVKVHWYLIRYPTLSAMHFFAILYILVPGREIVPRSDSSWISLKVKKNTFAAQNRTYKNILHWCDPFPSFIIWSGSGSRSVALCNIRLCARCSPPLHL